MKKILGLGIAAILVIGMVAGGTWAYFSDTETASANVFSAGTLDLGLSTTAGQNPTQSITATFSSGANWKPGATKNGTIYINNEGTIPMNTLTVTFDYTSVVTTGRPTNIDGTPWTTDPTDLFDKMIKATTATYDSVSVAAIAGKTLAELKAAGAITLGSGLAADTEKALVITFTFDTAATNGCQGNELTISMSFAGAQTS